MATRPARAYYKLEELDRRHKTAVALENWDVPFEVGLFGRWICRMMIECTFILYIGIQLDDICILWRTYSVSFAWNKHQVPTFGNFFFGSFLWIGSVKGMYLHFSTIILHTLYTMLIGNHLGSVSFDTQSFNLQPGLNSFMRAIRSWIWAVGPGHGLSMQRGPSLSVNHSAAVLRKMMQQDSTAKVRRFMFIQLVWRPGTIVLDFHHDWLIFHNMCHWYSLLTIRSNTNTLLVLGCCYQSEPVSVLSQI